MTLDPIAIATSGYVCSEVPNDIAIATDGYVCFQAVVQALGGNRREFLSFIHGFGYWRR